MTSFSLFRNLLGSFSDAAILFPLLILLSGVNAFSMPTALLTTGVAYIVAALVFRVPMSVQPLKSIAVASITIGASFSEIRWAGFLVGLVCLVFGIFRVEQIAKKIPESLIHQLQAGLGVLLVWQGIQALGGFRETALTPTGLGVFLLVGFMVFFPEIKRVPVLGFFATAGFIFALYQNVQNDPSGRENSLIQEQASLAHESLRPAIVLSLLLPQLALTSANSVLATRNVCERYFGAVEASRVTVQRLLRSIGIGNMIVAFVGGMPFCHGSGGVTAHARGGSTNAFSTAFMGVVLLILSFWSMQNGGGLLVYPKILISSLLIATGCFHFRLAIPTLSAQYGWMKLGVACLLTIVTHNLMWVLFSACLLELLFRRNDPIGKGVKA